jgi:predicted metal-binding protein
VRFPNGEADVKIGIIICDRYRSCAGGKCFRAVRERQGAFARYAEEADVEVVGFTSCGGCPGGNIEYAPEEMVKNGAEAIHLATGMVVGYPPCPWLDYFQAFIPARYGVAAHVGTHPIPQKYLNCHENLPSLTTLTKVRDLMASEAVRRAYD